MSPAARGRGTTGVLTGIVSTALLLVATIVLGSLAAWPIYETDRVWLVMGVGVVTAALVVWAGRRWNWGALTVVWLFAVFILLLPTLAIPSALGAGGGGLVEGIGDGIASVALGWKQLLTLSLPVGTYRTVLVPALVTAIVSGACIAGLALPGGRLARWAAIPFLLPVIFGTVFGSSAVSTPLTLGSIVIPAPREVSLWLVAAGLAVAWVSWAAGIERRAALKLGRAVDGSAAGHGSIRRNTIVRSLLGAGVVVVALGAGTAFAPMLDGGDRTVPRDRVDPEIVVRELTSPLSGYRSWKRDDAFDAELFSVATTGELPSRLRTAVLDGYDGVDFTPGTGQRFTRYPSGSALDESSTVTVTIADGYSGVWVPLAMPLGGTPTFTGSRAGALSDSFYVNRDAGSAVAVPTRAGLRAGDGVRADMSTAEDAALDAQPWSPESLVDLNALPELTRWLDLQQLPATAAGLTEAIERLRDRGYLSHSLTDDEGERAWLDTLAKAHGTRFVSSAGGHSIARIEQLFAQLSDQQVLAGPDADADMLVAGIGDDEQFSAAAALIARAMGFDSRVVLGVRLGDGGADEEDDSGVPGIPACTEVCTGEHVAAWAEVRGADGVWAPLDVSPQVTRPPSTLEEGEQLPEHPTVPEERDATESDPPVGNADSGERTDAPEPPTEVSPIWAILRGVGLGVAALALLVLAAGFIPFVKRLRTRRRRTAEDPESRALGAWFELLDTYADTGRTPAVAVSGAPGARASRRDVAAAMGIPGGEWIAWTVDRAVYAREGISDDAAAQLWQVVDDEKADIARGDGRWGRVRALMSLASFGAVRRGHARTRARNRTQGNGVGAMGRRRGKGHR